MNTLQAVIGDYTQFVREIVAEVEVVGFDMADFMVVDHICYRVETLDQYEDKKTQLEAYGERLAETSVNKRPIATYKLHQPIRVASWRIDALELPAPKPGRAETEGLEHAEFVIYDTVEQFLAKYSGMQFDTKAADRGINPEIGMRLPSGKGVKFHLLPLTAVVQLEKLLGVKTVLDGVRGIS